MKELKKYKLGDNLNNIWDGMSSGGQSALSSMGNIGSIASSALPQNKHGNISGGGMAASQAIQGAFGAVGSMNIPIVSQVAQAAQFLTAGFTALADKIKENKKSSTYYKEAKEGIDNPVNPFGMETLPAAKYGGKFNDGGGYFPQKENYMRNGILDKEAYKKAKKEWRWKPTGGNVDIMNFINNNFEFPDGQKIKQYEGPAHNPNGGPGGIAVDVLGNPTSRNKAKAEVEGGEWYTQKKDGGSYIHSKHKGNLTAMNNKFYNNMVKRGKAGVYDDITKTSMDVYTAMSERENDNLNMLRAGGTFSGPNQSLPEYGEGNKYGIFGLSNNPTKFSRSYVTNKKGMGPYDLDKSGHLDSPEERDLFWKIFGKEFMGKDAGDIIQNAQQSYNMIQENKTSGMHKASQPTQFQNGGALPQFGPGSKFFQNRTSDGLRRENKPVKDPYAKAASKGHFWEMPDFNWEDAWANDFPNPFEYKNDRGQQRAYQNAAQKWASSLDPNMSGTTNPNPNSQSRQPMTDDEKSDAGLKALGIAGYTGLGLSLGARGAMAFKKPIQDAFNINPEADAAKNIFRNRVSNTAGVMKQDLNRQKNSMWKEIENAGLGVAGEIAAKQNLQVNIDDAIEKANVYDTEKNLQMRGEEGQFLFSKGEQDRAEARDTQQKNADREYGRREDIQKFFGEVSDVSKNVFLAEKAKKEEYNFYRKVLSTENFKIKDKKDLTNAQSEWLSAQFEEYKNLPEDQQPEWLKNFMEVLQSKADLLKDE